MNISLFKVFMSEDVIKPVNEVLMSGYITQGKQVEKYETELKKFLGTEHLLTVNSGTAGLTLATRLLKNKDTISEIRYEELLENYRQFTSHNIVTLNNTTDNPLEFIINCIEKNLINLYKRIIVFAPGHLYTKKEGVGSHLEITNYFNNIDLVLVSINFDDNVIWLKNIILN